MSKAPFVVGVTGGSGSGKTSLIRSLRERFPAEAVSVVSQDNYYLPIERQQRDGNGRVNFDLPEGVDLHGLTNDLERLKNGASLRRLEYTFNNASREAALVEVPAAPLVIVEGLFVLHHVPLRELFDLRVFVMTDTDEELRRRLDRDQRERGYSREDILYQWENHVMPAHENFLLPHRHTCELHVDNNGAFDDALAQMHAGLLRHVPWLREAMPQLA